MILKTQACLPPKKLCESTVLKPCCITARDILLTRRELPLTRTPQVRCM